MFVVVVYIHIIYVRLVVDRVEPAQNDLLGYLLETLGVL